MGNAPANLQNIAISTIRENPVALRGVDRDNDKFISLRDAIGRVGILNPINVREKSDPDGTRYFEICDGLHRYSAAKDLGLEILPANILTLDDASVLEAQVLGNICRVDTKPVEYTKQLQRMFAMNPTLTLTEMAERVCQSPAWINQRLGLLKLEDSIQSLVDEGKINLSNAYALAKLPPAEQVNYVDAAITMVPAEFVGTVNTRVKELRDAAKQGKEATPAQFEAVPHLRKLGELKAAQTDIEVASAVTAKVKAKTAAEGFAAAINWVLSLDPDSVAEQQAKYEARAAKLAEAKKARDIERAEKKAVEAAEAAAKVKEAANVS